MISLAGLARAQAKAGHEVFVLHTRRPDTPAEETLAELFPEPIRRSEISRDGRRASGFFALTIGIFKALTQLRPDAIHLHSSYAGVSGRLVAGVLGMISRTVYSPHGFAFLNSRSRRISGFALLVEKLLNRLGGKLALVSNSEMTAARSTFDARRTYVLQNRVDISKLPKHRHRVDGRLRVGTVGRISHSKGPWKFAEVARELAYDASFVWIGDGPQTDKANWLRDSGVEVSGWQTPENAIKLAAELDIYVSTALWEGMPLAVMEAQALGIPCVVSNIVGNVDVVEHGITGYVCSDHQTIVMAIKRLVEDEVLRKFMGRAAAERAKIVFAHDSLSADSIEIYRA
ncbi:glycosyltransferase [Arthrobacter sp. MMS18-M83]|uniref:glycosyltransferase n=1 Tax=Arthrobacter sp. MMS18-M83 TaxID=2996261 RepID=UPI00227B3232|nr:glycosyltransferase [Arthrobacter sp. MMS18-M83]WAH99600.1 glycosyltransferase [Arthrobacter sp. MMS18-M83]